MCALIWAQNKHAQWFWFKSFLKVIYNVGGPSIYTYRSGRQDSTDALIISLIVMKLCSHWLGSECEPY